MTDLIGWFSAAILLATIGRQVYTEWHSGSIAGVSKWLFIGQIAASLGFVVYSYLLSNWVFVVTNVFMLAMSLLGQWLYFRNKNHPGSKRQATSNL